MKMKVQHHKQQQSCKTKCPFTDQKTQQKSAPVGLSLSHLKFIIPNFFADEECAEENKCPDETQTQLELVL